MMHTAFLGDREHAFALPVTQIEALEKATGSPIGAVFDRVRRLAFSYADLAHTIRLALIGGGATPKEAADLVAEYVAPRPLIESATIAGAVLAKVMFGDLANTEAGNG